MDKLNNRLIQAVIEPAFFIAAISARHAAPTRSTEQIHAFWGSSICSVPNLNALSRLDYTDHYSKPSHSLSKFLICIEFSRSVYVTRHLIYAFFDATP
jgi:hypothetical protein